MTLNELLEEYGDEREQYLMVKNKKIEVFKHTLDELLNAYSSPEKMPGAAKKMFNDTLEELRDINPEAAKKYFVGETSEAMIKIYQNNLNNILECYSNKKDMPKAIQRMYDDTLRELMRLDPKTAKKYKVK